MVWPWRVSNVEGGAQAPAVDERPPGRRRKASTTGKARRRKSTRVSGRSSRRPSRSPLKMPIPEGGEYLLYRDARTTAGALDDDAHLVLRGRRRLHRVGALRSQPHRSDPGEEDLQAGRDGADHDQVAVGERHGAADHRARRRAHLEGRSSSPRRSRPSPCRSPRRTSPTSSSPCSS